MCRDRDTVRRALRLRCALGLAGRILTAWSCEYVYFVSCEAHADIGSDGGGGDGAASRVPVLNVLSHADPFFGATGSVASDVSAPGPGAYGDVPTGSCAARMRKQGLRGGARHAVECGWRWLPVATTGRRSEMPC